MRALALVVIGPLGCSGSDHVTDAACAPAIVYLDRAGGSYDHGSADDASANLSLLVDMPRVLPAWPHDDVNWGELVDCIRTALAPFPLQVTEVDPGVVPHLELVFTTAYWAGPAGTSYVVPDSCRPGHQVEFVFGDALPTYTRACQIAMIGFAEMTANLTLGDNCNDLVNLAMDCAPVRSFIDQTVHCVDDFDQPTTCRCGGATTENVFQALAAQFPSCP